MKFLLTALLIFFSFNYCNSQKQGYHDKVLKIITMGNSEKYYTGSIFLTRYLKTGYLIDKIDSIKLFDSDTLIKYFNKSDLKLYDFYFALKINTPYDSYSFNIGSMKPFFLDRDTFIYTLNYDTLKYKEIDDSNQVLQEEIEKMKIENFNLEKEIVLKLMDEAEESVAYYSSKIDGKSHNKIADYLYDEGFSRSFSSGGSVFKEIYSITYTYGGKPYREKSYVLNISIWNSYGYGKLFYSIDYEIYLLGKCYIWKNGEWLIY